MPSDYPPPSSALMVWLSGDGTLSVRVPHATDPQGPAHVLSVIPDAQGMQQLVRVLAHRKLGGDMRIGTPAAPTQSQLLRALSETFAGAAKRLPTGATSERPAGPKARATPINHTTEALLDLLLKD